MLKKINVAEVFLNIDQYYYRRIEYRILNAFIVFEPKHFKYLNIIDFNKIEDWKCFYKKTEELKNKDLLILIEDINLSSYRQYFFILLKKVLTNYKENNLIKSVFNYYLEDDFLDLDIDSINSLNNSNFTDIKYVKNTSNLLIKSFPKLSDYKKVIMKDNKIEKYKEEFIRKNFLLFMEKILTKFYYKNKDIELFFKKQQVGIYSVFINKKKLYDIFFLYDYLNEEEFKINLNSLNIIEELKKLSTFYYITPPEKLIKEIVIYKEKEILINMNNNSVSNKRKRI